MADSLPTPRDSPQVVEPRAAASAAVHADHLAQGIRFLALSKYAQASESLSYAVEALTELNGEIAMDNVEALILYGKALLANAIEQSAVLGGQAPTTSGPGPTDHTTPATSTSTATDANANAGPSNAAFSFSGDADDDDDDEGENERDGEGEDGGPDDDFEQAFVVLDMARRTIELELERLEREIADHKEDQDATAARADLDKVTVTRKETLAEVHRLLGDVATESEQFENAVEEYSAGLSILTQTRPPSDRILSEQHMMLALALEFLPDQTPRAVSHAEKAKSVLVVRLRELEAKDTAAITERERKEVQDLKELIVDVENKIEDLKTVPVAPAPSAADLAMAEFMRQATGSGTVGSSTVNDLNSLVKKKKKTPTTTSTTTTTTPSASTAVGGGDERENPKRKADGPVVGVEGDGENSKKAKLSPPPPPVAEK